MVGWWVRGCLEVRRGRGNGMRLKMGRKSFRRWARSRVRRRMRIRKRIHIHASSDEAIEPASTIEEVDTDTDTVAAVAEEDEAAGAVVEAAGQETDEAAEAGLEACEAQGAEGVEAVVVAEKEGQEAEEARASTARWTMRASAGTGTRARGCSISDSAVSGRCGLL